MVLENGTTETEIEHFDFGKLPKLSDMLERARLSNQSSPNLGFVSLDRSKQSTATSSLNASPRIPSKQLFVQDEENLADNSDNFGFKTEGGDCERFNSFIEICTEEMEIDNHQPLQPPAMIPTAYYSNVDTDWELFKQTISFLAEAGYNLLPFVDGNWASDAITDWRIVPEKKLVNALLVAAESLDSLEE